MWKGGGALLKKNTIKNISVGLSILLVLTLLYSMVAPFL